MSYRHRNYMLTFFLEKALQAIHPTEGLGAQWTGRNAVGSSFGQHLSNSASVATKHRILSSRIDECAQ